MSERPPPTAAGAHRPRHAAPPRRPRRGPMPGEELVLRAGAAGEPEGRRRAPVSVLIAATTMTMVAVGLLMTLSASSIEAYRAYGSSFMLFNRQIVGAAIGLTGMSVVARMDYRRLRPLARPALLGVVVLLVAVLIPGVGVTVAGSARWLPLGPFSLQPSELAKLAAIVFCAWSLDRKGARIADPRELATILPGVGGVLFLIMLQPDLGTAMIVAGGALVVVFLAGTRLRHLLTVGVAGMAGTLGLILTEGYRRERLFSFLDPWSDPLNTGYQIIQGQIALGSGGLLGLGLGASRQKWSYLPHAHTDFIYAIIGEELGLVGTVAVLALFVFLVQLGVRAARRAPDRFGMLLAGGVTGWVGLQALINMGAVTGLLPITGVPLPLISFGGSSLVVTLVGIGVLLSVARKARA